MWKFLYCESLLSFPSWVDKSALSRTHFSHVQGVLICFETWVDKRTWLFHPLMGIWQDWLGSYEKHLNLTQPNPCLRGDGTPCEGIGKLQITHGSHVLRQLPRIKVLTEHQRHTFSEPHPTFIYRTVTTTPTATSALRGKGRSPCTSGEGPTPDQRLRPGDRRPTIIGRDISESWLDELVIQVN